MQYLRNVVSLQLDANLCTGCGLCVMVCPHSVFEIRNRKARITDLNNCMECGACALNCQFGALSVKWGVGCATGILNGILNNTEPSCECATEKKKESSCC